VYAARNDQVHAIADFDEALKVEPNNIQALTSRAFAYRTQGNSAKALSDYDAAIRLAPANGALYAARGDVYGGTGDLVKANADYTRAMQLDPRIIRPISTLTQTPNGAVFQSTVPLPPGTRPAP